MSRQTKFRTRQAPSPTGYLHLGTARTILFTKLITKINNGDWFLRLEDTDRTRLNKEAAKELLKTLEQINLTSTEGIVLDSGSQPNAVRKLFWRIRAGKETEEEKLYGVDQKGEFGPYIQSQRLSLYRFHAEQMINKKLAYWSYLDEEDRAELQEIKKIDKKPINYFLRNLEKVGGDESEIYKLVDEGLMDERKPTLRYKLQRDKKIIVKDELLGKSEFDLNLEEDFTILKSDGFPTYHLAHVVDDYLMETSLVIRAQEWFPSLPKHATMFLDYWGEAPKYIHLPFILGETGNKKMSKRDGNVNMQDYLDQGYLPEAIINYLAFLGWNPGTEKELYLKQEDF